MAVLSPSPPTLSSENEIQCLTQSPDYKPGFMEKKRDLICKGVGKKMSKMAVKKKQNCVPQIRQNQRHDM